MKKKLYVFLVLWPILMSCTNHLESNADIALIKSVIIRYNELLAEGYRLMDMNKLGQTATREIVLQAYHHMTALGEGRKKMLSSVKSINFNKTIFSEEMNTVQIHTEETWDYSYVDLGTTKIEPQNSIDYEMTYTLTKIGTKWLISEITTNKTKYEKKDTTPSIFRRPEGEKRGTVRGK